MTTHDQRDRIRNIVLTALFAAMIFTAITLVRVPNPIGGIIHFGDTFIFLAGAVLPFPYPLFAAGIGAGLANINAGLFMWAPFTVVIKPLMTLCFTARTPKILESRRNYIAPFFAGAINLVLYYLALSLLIGLGIREVDEDVTMRVALLIPMANVPGDLIQFAGSAVGYFALAKFIDRSGVRG